MNKYIRVWDPLVRLFHWSLVLAFIISYLTGEEESDLHIYSGYAVLGLITFRLFWGVIGSKYARFSNFVTSRKNLMTYLKSLLSGKAKHYMGHNPAGGWMVMALILSLFITTLSGLKLYAVEEGPGPLALDSVQIQLISTAHADGNEYAENDNEGDEDLWEEVHEAASNFSVFLIFIHIAGVFFTSLIHKENLPRAMITGRKKSE